MYQDMQCSNNYHSLPLLFLTIVTLYIGVLIN